MKIRSLTLIALLATSACSSLPPPSEVPVEPVAQPKLDPPAPMLPADYPTGPWTDWPLAAGDWVYRQDGRGSIALFGMPGRDAKVTLRCDKGAERIYLSVAGSIGANAQMVVRSSSAMSQWAALPTGGSPNYAAAMIMPNDPGLDAMIYSRGRIAIELPGYILQQVIPNWTEIARVVEDCRR